MQVVHMLQALAPESLAPESQLPESQVPELQAHVLPEFPQVLVPMPQAPALQALLQGVALETLQAPLQVVALEALECCAR